MSSPLNTFFSRVTLGCGAIYSTYKFATCIGLSNKTAALASSIVFIPAFYDLLPFFRYKWSSMTSSCPSYTPQLNYGCSLPTNSTPTYNPLHPSVIDWIQETGESVVEVFAGNGQNAEKLRKAGITVFAYDLVPNEHVKYGVAGTIENKDEAEILLVCAGMSVLPSIESFRGRYLIIGGYVGTNMMGISVPEEFESVTSLSDMVPRIIRPGMILDIRPSFHTVIEKGWKYVRAFSAPRDRCNDKKYDCFYIFERSKGED